MTETTREHLLTEFGPDQWTGQPSNGAGYLFLGAGMFTFLVCLVLMIFIAPLRNFAAVVPVCILGATLMTVADVVSKTRREKFFLTGLTARVNGAILEITGDPGARVSAGKLLHLIESGTGLPLGINGVPGVELRVNGKSLGQKRILLVVAAPNFGLESFDVLLETELQRKIW